MRSDTKFGPDRFSSFDVFWTKANYLYLFILYILVCNGVCLYPVNVKTYQPTGTKFCVGPRMTPGKVYECLEFQNNCHQKIVFS